VGSCLIQPKQLISNDSCATKTGAILPYFAPRVASKI